MLSDIDGAFELNSNFVFIECKQPQDPKMSLGQQIMYERLAMVSDKFTVLECVLTGERTKPQALKFVPTNYRKIGRDREMKDTNLDTFRKMFKTWEKSALQGIQSEAIIL
jgi:hypothetical protein